MKPTRIITLALLLMFVVPLNAQTLYHPEKSKRKKRQTIRQELKISTASEEPIANPYDEGGAGVILPALIETGISIVKSELKKREESFSAEYSVKESNDGFWQEETELHLPILEYKKKYAEDETALEFILIPYQSQDGLAFRYQLDTLTLWYSEARANRRHSGINIEIDIKFSAFVKGKEEYAKKDLGQNAIKLQGVQFDTPYSNKPYSGWFAVIPPLGTDGKANNGNYEIELTIKEANPGVLNTQKISKFFEDNGETIQGATKVIIENIFKEDEEEEKKDDEKKGDDGKGKDEDVEEPKDDGWDKEKEDGNRNKPSGTEFGANGEGVR